MLSDEDVTEVLFVANQKMKAAKTKDTIYKVYRQFRVWSYVTRQCITSYDLAKFHAFSKSLKMLRNEAVKELKND